MKRIIIVLILLLLTACSSVLPDRPANLFDFIPKEEKIEQEMCSREFTFKNDHFDKDCQWTELERVVDGDTLIIADNVRVRFIGIDTPETKDPRKPLQKFGPEASEKTKELLSESKRICLLSDPEGDELDKYGRRLAYIFTESGVDVNAELLRTGYAKGYFYFPFERKEEFRCYAAQAKEEEVGMWE
jgi:endonuclease YncB( thermonuclease family)